MAEWPAAAGEAETEKKTTPPRRLAFPGRAAPAFVCPLSALFEKGIIDELGR